MIAINCTHCQQRLEMDEAFAGGVCRCQYCGTIQTVPSHLKNGAAAAAGKVVHPSGGSGTGLDDLAEVVASSGLSRSGLTKTGRAPQRHAAGTASAPGAASAATVDYARHDRRKRSALVPLLIAVGALTLVALGVVAFSGLSRSTTNTPTTMPVSGGPVLPNGGRLPDGEDASLTVDGPAFADVPLTGNAVVYLVDRSQANSEVLDTLKASIYFSARSLGPQRRFQILFWNHNEEGIVAYPAEGLAPATPAEVDAAGKQFEDVIGYGNTDLKATLEKAVAANPDAIVIATAKGLYLEDDTLAVFDAALQGKTIKVYAFPLGETESPVLKQIAEKTGGGYRELSQRQLKKLKYHVPGS